ncbi:hypothetical protein CDAR_418151 [Caerostris darwini]|uniref:Uncharacterized protein n=1 Tax=Caerostris darwini TaxID=1538125 RepID=A0AAV4RP87_9ARAC|nr:hypothetical protein CDAR_418151 [Caerostris darwini]
MEGVCTIDENGELQPTKAGVSLKPDVYYAFHNKLCAFMGCEDPDASIVVKKDVCIFNQNENCISIQRLFERKDMTFSFLPEKVVLNKVQYITLLEYFNEVSDYVKKKLLTYTFTEYVKYELKKRPDDSYDEKWGNYDTDTPAGPSELSESLCDCLTNNISININQFIRDECFVCKNGLELTEHECKVVSPQECFNIYFVKALFAVDWHALAIDFINLNINGPYLREFAYEMDTFLDCNLIFKKIEEIYVNGCSKILL